MFINGIKVAVLTIKPTDKNLAANHNKEIQVLPIGLHNSRI